MLIVVRSVDHRPKVHRLRPVRVMHRGEGDAWLDSPESGLQPTAMNAMVLFSSWISGAWVIERADALCPEDVSGIAFDVPEQAVRRVVFLDAPGRPERDECASCGERLHAAADFCHHSRR